MLPKTAVAGAAVAIAAVVGSAIGGLDWRRPRQVLHAPYVADVPVGLLTTLVGLALTGLLVAAVLQRLLVPARPAGLRALLLAFLAVAGAGAATWAGLYASAIENAIPVFDWAFFAVPVGLATAIADGHDHGNRTTHRPFVTGLLVAVPIAAVNALGWSIYGTPRSGLTTTAVSGGIGLVVGLMTAYYSGSSSATPPSPDPSGPPQR